LNDGVHRMTGCTLRRRVEPPIGDSSFVATDTEMNPAPTRLPRASLYHFDLRTPALASRIGVRPSSCHRRASDVHRLHASRRPSIADPLRLGYGVAAAIPAPT
jgi:hypothetical protein